MHRVAMGVVLVLVLMVALATTAGAQPAEVKQLQEQVKSLQDANVVMKEDLAKTQLQLAELRAAGEALAQAAARQLEDYNRQLEQIRQDLERERAAHEAALREQQEARERAEAEAARQRQRVKERQLWLYIVGAAAAIAVASQ